MSETLLNLNCIYSGFDGEVNCYGQGTPTIFVRFQGCNLKCRWCDTKYAQDSKKGDLVKIDQVLEEIASFKGIRKVTITGGEPLLQKDAFVALTTELKPTHNITVETNGSIPWEDVRLSSIFWVVDYKLPSSKQFTHMLSLDTFLMNLDESDFIKFVVDNPGEFKLAVTIQDQLQRMGAINRFAYSPTKDIPARVLANMMLQTPEILGKAVLNTQLHKIIWPNEKRR